MFIKTTMALAAALLASVASVGSAQARATGIESAHAFTPNMHERFRSAPARLRSDRAFMPDANQVLEENNWFATEVADHASSPYAGGGGK